MADSDWNRHRPNGERFQFEDCTESLRFNASRSLLPMHQWRVFYSSAIAHRWAQRYQTPIARIIDRVNHQILGLAFPPESLSLGPSSSHPGESSSFSLSVQISICSQGWIELSVEWPDVAIWLQSLPLDSPRPILNQLRGSHRADKNDVQFSEQSELTSLSADLQIGFWQYTHARCCSLLRQAIASGQITASHALAYQTQTQSLQELGWLTQPHSTPWQILLTHGLVNRNHLDHNPGISAERDLLLQVLTILDAWAMPSAKAARHQDLPNQIQQLCQSFNQFHRHCRMGEAAQKLQPKLALARLGLVSLTQRCLWELIQNGLGLEAPCWV